MKKVKCILLGLCFPLIFNAQRSNPFYLEGALSPAVHGVRFPIGLNGAFGIEFKERHHAVFRGGEFIDISNRDMISTVDLIYRYQFGSGLYMGTGFSHRHTLGLIHYSDGAGAMLGSHSSILHQSGWMAEAGYLFGPVMNKGFLSRIRPYAAFQTSWMFGSSAAEPFCSASAGLRLELGKQK